MTGYRVLLVGSGGGHLAQLRRLAPWWSDHDRAWVTFEVPGAEVLSGERTYPAHAPTTRNAMNFVRNLGLAWRVLRREQPAVIVSTGAGVALPFFLVGRLLGIPRVYLEVYDRIDSRTLTGRLCRPLSDLFLLQWESQRETYGAGLVVGPLY
jgi:UDP-N-acetylglucosamine:LPS N-acetylglucosamine transferase